MNRLFLSALLLLVSVFSASAQNAIFSTKKGEFSFYSKAPLGDIEAKNTNVTSLININNNEVVVRVPVTQFQFSNKLMQQHFNENYMESEKYPYATFKGKINETVDFKKPGVYNVSSTGVLNLHGVNNKRTINGKLTVNDTGLALETNFDIFLYDHKIEIPKLVFKKIAEKVNVSASMNYSAYKK